MKRLILGLAAGLLRCAGAAYAMEPAKYADSSLGKILVDTKGMTLYIFDKDSKGATKSTCIDKCIVNWPPFVAAEGAKAEGDWTIVDVTDKDGKAEKMWAYDGKPLYYFDQGHEARRCHRRRRRQRLARREGRASSRIPPAPAAPLLAPPVLIRRAACSAAPATCLDCRAAMNAPAQPLLDRFADIVGPAYAAPRSAEAIAPYLIEPRDKFHGRDAAGAASGQRRRGRGDPEARQRDAARRSCRRAAIPGWSAARCRRTTGNEIVLSLSRLNRVRAVDADSNTMIAEAGVTLAEARAAAEAVDRLFPLSLASEGSCEIGGNLSTNAGGTGVLAYGNMRELVLGVEVVLRLRRGVGRPEDAAQGQYRLRPQAPVHRRGRHARRRHRGGADAGAEAARRRRRLRRAQGPGDRARTLPHRPRARGTQPHRLRAHPAGRPRIRAPPRAGHARSARLTAPLVRADRDTPRAAEPGGRRRGGRGDLRRRARSTSWSTTACSPQSLEQAAAFWHLRETMSEVQKLEGGSIKHDVAVPVASGAGADRARLARRWRS